MLLPSIIFCDDGTVSATTALAEPEEYTAALELNRDLAGHDPMTQHRCNTDDSANEPLGLDLLSA